MQYQLQNIIVMEIKISTKYLLKILHLLAWIIYVGLCIEAGAIIFNSIYTFAVNPGTAQHFWDGINLSALYKYDHGHFLAETALMSIAAVLKTFIFYLLIKILHDKKLDMSQPFTKDVRRFISTVAYLSLGIGLFCWRGVEYTEWLVKQGVAMPDIYTLRLDGADVWVFMGVTLLVIAQIFKRGMEIQSENELTV